jgi:hypothetical protein
MRTMYNFARNLRNDVKEVVRLTKHEIQEIERITTDKFGREEAK